MIEDKTNTLIKTTNTTFLIEKTSKTHKKSKNQPDLHTANTNTDDVINSQNNSDGHSIKSDRKRFRRAKVPQTEKKFICKICFKAYLSFPALYTHKRNKHNLIPVTGKPSLLRTLNLNIVGRHNSNCIRIDRNVKSILGDIIYKYQEASFYLFSNPESCLYNTSYKIERDNFYLTLFYLSNLKKEIPIPQPNDKPSIYMIMALYLILLMDISPEKSFLGKLLRWAILLKEVFNLSGWEHEKEYYHLEKFHYYDYCSLAKIEEVPALASDFINFVKMDENHFGLEFNEHIDLVVNFCSWLFNHDYTDFKMNHSDMVCL